MDLNLAKEIEKEAEKFLEFYTDESLVSVQIKGSEPIFRKFGELLSGINIKCPNPGHNHKAMMAAEVLVKPEVRFAVFSDGRLFCMRVRHGHAGMELGGIQPVDLANLEEYQTSIRELVQGLHSMLFNASVQAEATQPMACA